MGDTNNLPRDTGAQQYLLQYTPPVERFDFFEIWLVFIRGYRVFIGFFIAVMAVTALYLLIVPLSFQATVRLSAPVEADIQPLQHEGVFIINKSSVYDAFKAKTMSRVVMRDFFDSNELASKLKKSGDESDEQLFQNFVRNNIIVHPNQPFTLVRFIWQDRDEAERLANEFVKLAERMAAAELVKDLEQIIKTKKEDLQRTITSKLSLEEARREDTIVQLREAAFVARQIGIDEPNKFIDAGKNSENASSPMVRMLEMNSVPLYARGWKALEAEVSVLSQRQTNEPFVPELRLLQEQLANLGLIKPDVSKLKTARIDQAAYASSQPVYPQRKSILVVGLIVGVALGLIAVFLAEFLRKFVARVKDYQNRVAT